MRSTGVGTWRRMWIALAAAAVAAAVMTTPPAVDAAEGPRIAFARAVGPADEARHYEIFTIAADGTDLQRLTRNDVEDHYPSFSPDGRRIAFARTRGGVGHIYVMDADGTNVRQVTRGDRTDALPDWSPDGRRLVFTRNFATQSDLFTISLDGGSATRLTNTAAREFAPEWSPDGGLIAFTKFAQAQDRFGIAVIRPRGTGTRWVAINPRSSQGYADANPTWSPSGERLAFSGDDRDIDVDIFTVRRDGTGRRRLTDLGSVVENPSWGPDGRLAVMHYGGIAVMNRDGTGVRMITPDRRKNDDLNPDSWPDWAPR